MNGLYRVHLLLVFPVSISTDKINLREGIRKVAENAFLKIQFIMFPKMYSLQLVFIFSILKGNLYIKGHSSHPAYK